MFKKSDLHYWKIFRRDNRLDQQSRFRNIIYQVKFYNSHKIKNVAELIKQLSGK